MAVGLRLQVGFEGMGVAGWGWAGQQHTQHADKGKKESREGLLLLIKTMKPELREMQFFKCPPQIL